MPSFTGGRYRALKAPSRKTVVIDGIEWAPATVSCSNCAPGSCLRALGKNWKRCFRCRKRHAVCPTVASDGTSDSQRAKKVSKTAEQKLVNAPINERHISFGKKSEEEDKLSLLDRKRSNGVGMCAEKALTHESKLPSGREMSDAMVETLTCLRDIIDEALARRLGNKINDSKKCVMKTR